MLCPLKTIDQLLRIPLYGKVILFRGDANFALDENGRAKELVKILVMKKSIDRLLAAGAIVVFISHNGRPKGKGFEEKYSLKPATQDFEEVLGREVVFSPDCVGIKRNSIIRLARPGSFILCENIRFNAGEQTNDETLAMDFASQLIECIDYFVNEAFSVSHRADTSVVTVCEVLGLQKCFVGYMFDSEFSKLSEIRDNTGHDLTIILGGAKIDKFESILGLLKRAKKLIIGGALANTFLEAESVNIGCSLSETKNLGQARDILQFARINDVQVFIPRDAVILGPNGKISTRPISWHSKDWINPSEKILDIGPITRQEFTDALTDSRNSIVFWNGPLGFTEDLRFGQGTYVIAKHLAGLKQAQVVFGGGDTVAALNMFEDVTKMVSANDQCYVSTSGGASLDFLKLGNSMPGVEINIRAAQIAA